MENSNYYEILKRDYIKHILDEYVIPRPLDYVSFDEIKVATNHILKYVIGLFKHNFCQIKSLWDNNQNVQFTIPILKTPLSIIYEVDTNEDDTLASFNPEVNPYEMCVNLKIFKNETNMNKILVYLQSRRFQVLLAHESTHFVQTLLYGETVMKKYVKHAKQPNGYYSSPIELEACIFMMIEDAFLSGKRLTTYEELKEYSEHTTSQFLSVAKNYILDNEPEVKDILNKNSNFLKLANEHLEETEFNFDIQPVPAPPNPNRMKYGYKIS